MIGSLTALTLATSLLAASPVASRWSDDYGYSLQMTRIAQRPLLVVMDKPTEEKHRIQPVRFLLDPTQAMLLSPYELCHVDVTTAYGRKVAKVFGVTKFPHTAILDKTGKVIIYQKTGGFRTDQWVSILMDHREGNRAIRIASADCFT